MYQTQTLLKLTNNCHSNCEERDKLKSDISLVSNHSAMTLKLSNSALIYKRDLSCQIFLLAERTWLPCHQRIGVRNDFELSFKWKVYRVLHTIFL